jgi:purine-binding chemotaxis protein CheW
MSQLTTFTLGDFRYGVDVMQIQEVTRFLPTTTIPLAPTYVRGLINLRGQIATAIGLRELFALEPQQQDQQSMTVICRVDGALLSLLVDTIGDVIEVAESAFEPIPANIKDPMKKFMGGVYKTSEGLISVIDLQKLANELNLFLNNEDQK